MASRMTLSKFLPVRFLIFLILAISFIGLLRLVQQTDQSEQEVVRKTRHLMGTLWEIQVVLDRSTDKGTAEGWIYSAFDEINRIEQIMSEWIEDSPISLVNRGAGKEPVSSPPELVSIIQRAIDYGDLSGGVFDITWQGLGRIWKLGEDFVPPSEEQISQGMKLVDYRKIRLEGSMVSLPEGFAIGLGGIAKGYAVDQAADILRKKGFHLQQMLGKV